MNIRRTRFFDVFRGKRKGALGTNGLMVNRLSENILVMHYSDEGGDCKIHLLK